MSESRKQLSRIERHAVAILYIKKGNGTPVVTEQEAKELTAAEIVELFESRIHYEHSTPYALTKNNHPTNVTVMTPSEHKPKTKIDVKEIARTKRIAKAQEAFRQKILAKTGVESDAPPKPKSRKMQSRPFPKGHRPMQSRKNVRGKRP